MSARWQHTPTSPNPDRWTVQRQPVNTLDCPFRARDRLTVVLRPWNGRILVTYRPFRGLIRRRTGWLVNPTPRAAKTMARRFLKEWDCHESWWRPPRMGRPIVMVMSVEEAHSLERASMGIPFNRGNYPDSAEAATVKDSEWRQ